MSLSKKDRIAIYAQLPNEEAALVERQKKAETELQSILGEYAKALADLQKGCTEQLLNLKPGRRAIGTIYDFYTENDGTLHRNRYKIVNTLDQEDYKSILNGVSLSLALMPELQALVKNRIFYDKFGSGPVALGNEVAAKEKLIEILKNNLANLNFNEPCHNKNSNDQLRYSVWQLGYDTNYGYRRNPFKILGGLLLGIFFCCTILGIGIGYQTLKGIKYEDTWLDTSPPGSSTGEVQHDFLGEFDLLFEDLSKLFSGKNAINAAIKKLEKKHISNSEKSEPNISQGSLTQSSSNLWKRPMSALTTVNVDSNTHTHLLENKS